MSGWGRAEVARALTALEGQGGAGDAVGALVDAAAQAPRPGARIVGLTGPPGVGKSTLAGRLVGAWRQADLTVGALCVDPSSRASGGALLGDRLRMRLSGDDDGVFVRSMAARQHLGGLAPATLDAALVMRAAFDRVLVETVGVGQSEVEVADLADVTVVVVQPGSGDALQFVKAGLMEVFDLLVVNKSDLGAIADAALRELRQALRIRGRRDLARGDGQAIAPVLAASAESGAGVPAIVEAIDAVFTARLPALAARRGAALRASVVRRFAEWHGMETVAKLGGLARLREHLDGVALDAPPSRLRQSLDALTHV
ncbi:MAG: hypothetical protein U1F43_25255 [Myxococcota bacterium]